MATYSISELVREFDITARAIRFYEDQGLLTPQRLGASGRTRVYSGRDRTRLKLTLRGKRLGLSLSEIKELLDVYESPKDTLVQLRRVLEALGRHRANLERQREDLELMLAEIATFESSCRRLLEQGGARPQG